MADYDPNDKGEYDPKTGFTRFKDGRIIHDMVHRTPIQKSEAPINSAPCEACNGKGFVQRDPGSPFADFCTMCGTTGVDTRKLLERIESLESQIDFLADFVWRVASLDGSVPQAPIVSPTE